MTRFEPVYTRVAFLTAPRCNAQSELSVASLAAEIIEVATEHANMLGIGFSALLPEGIAWVLSRLTIEMIRYPRMHERYSIETWIETFTRSYSDRNFRIYLTETGEVIGYVRSVWTVIDIKERRLSDLSRYIDRVPVLSDKECPVARQSRIPLAAGDDSHSRFYEFRVTDIDFNRHVNTVRYIEMIVNTCGLEVYDRQFIRRLELSFRHEAVYGQTARIVVAPSGLCTIRDVSDEGPVFVVARVERAYRM